MSIWGSGLDARYDGSGDTSKPGWRDDTERPGIERYWTGTAWDDDIAPRPKPEPAWKGARTVVLGILIAAAVIFTVWRMQQPSDTECMAQVTKVVTGQALAVEDACLDR